MLIATGVTLAVASAPAYLPFLAIGTCCLACYLASGVDELSDLSNPYYFMATAPSIFLSLVPGGSEAKIAKITGESAIKLVSKSVNSVLVKNKITNAKDLMKFSACGYLEGTLRLSC